MHDFVVIGGGIIGLATGMRLVEQFPRKSVLLLEKERGICAHQSGRNSGVIHSGIYYRPGSLKARMCRTGNASVVDFCRKNDVRYRICGKLIVATSAKELAELEKLFQRGTENGIQPEKIGPEKVKEIEPHATGLAALWVPGTGIVNFAEVAEKYVEKIKESLGELRFNARVERISSKNGVHVVQTTAGDFEGRFLINCAGLYSDHVARLDGVEPAAKIIPFRGEYYELKPEKRYLVKGLVYPVPNPDFPFLGVHCTRMIDGAVHLGPNAVLAFKREGYQKTDFHAGELVEILGYAGFWKLALRNLGEGAREMVRSFSKAAFVRSLQRLVPSIEKEDIVPCAAGVRAQAVSPDGQMIDDFLIVRSHKAIHVCNAPSPAATASLEIARHVVALIPLMQ
jgi:(S)-2-hydroxyglutarate dehydrogenase